MKLNVDNHVRRYLKQTGYFELAGYGKEVLTGESWKPEPQMSQEDIKALLKDVWESQKIFGLFSEAREVFGLERPEQYALFLSLLVDLDGGFGSAFDLLGGIRGRPTLQLAADMWRINHGGELHLRMGLLERFFLDEKRSPELVLKRHVAECLAGYRGLEMDSPPADLPEEEPEGCRMFEKLKGRRGGFYFYGQEGSGRRFCLARMAEELGMPVVWIRDSETLEQNLFLAAVHRCAVGVCLPKLWESARPYLPYLELAAVIGAEPEAWSGMEELLPVHFDTPDMEERYQIWVHKGRRFRVERTVDLRRLANQYVMTPGEIERSLERAAQAASLDGNGPRTISSLHLREGIRAVLGGDFKGRAHAVKCAFGWGDLILPDRQKRRLRQACSQMRLRHQVLEQWKLREVMSYGLGIAMVFAGPPGTGKTMAAQVVAGELEMELYKVELTTVVSKYIGETEKNLKQIFEEARKSQVILFFDEADILFGKRTEVKEANDKYSNMEAAFLIQEMERYEGVVILATNLLKNMDEAFKRRMKFIVEFPFPDRMERKKIWEKAIPDRLPSEDLDLDFLAERFELSGSNIRNIVYHGAFLAAAGGGPLGMGQLMQAVQNEYEKAGKLLSRDEAGPYVGYLEGGLE